MTNYEKLGREAEGEDVSDFLAGAVNTGVSGEAFGEKLQGEHRWLQQETFNSVLKPGIKALAGAGTDARNENVVQQCRDICEKMNWEY